MSFWRPWAWQLAERCVCRWGWQQPLPMSTVLCSLPRRSEMTRQTRAGCPRAITADGCSLCLRCLQGLGGGEKLRGDAFGDYIGKQQGAFARERPSKLELQHPRTRRGMVL